MTGTFARSSRTPWPIPATATPAAAGSRSPLDLAAAEHYLFAFFMVCKGAVSPLQMRALVVGYDAKKWIDRAKGNPNAIATTGNPVSPPNRDVVRWGLTGVSDGSREHDRCNASVRRSGANWRRRSGLARA